MTHSRVGPVPARYRHRCVSLTGTSFRACGSCMRFVHACVGVSCSASIRGCERCLHAQLNARTDGQRTLFTVLAVCHVCCLLSCPLSLEPKCSVSSMIRIMFHMYTCTNRMHEPQASSMFRIMFHMYPCTCRKCSQRHSHVASTCYLCAKACPQSTATCQT